MKLVAAAAAFLLGTTAALEFGLGPGMKIPPAAFFLLLAASVIAVAGALLARRHVGSRHCWCVIALLGMWRGGHAAAVDASGEWRGIPETPGVVTLEGELLTDPAPSNFNTRLRLDVAASTVDGQRSEAFFRVDVYANRLVDRTGSGIAARPVNGFRYGDRYVVTGRFDPSQRTDANWWRAGSRHRYRQSWSETTRGIPSADGSRRLARPWLRPSNDRQAERAPTWASH